MPEVEQRVDHTKDGQADSEFILASVNLVRFMMMMMMMTTTTTATKTWTSSDSG